MASRESVGIRHVQALETIVARLGRIEAALGLAPDDNPAVPAPEPEAKSEPEAKPAPAPKPTPAPEPKAVPASTKGK